MISNIDFIKKYKQFFPYKKIRKNQKKAIKFILKEFLNNNKKYVILEAGTGVGKSAIGVTVSRFIKYYNKLNQITHELTEDNIVFQDIKKKQEKEKNEISLKLSKYKFKPNKKLEINEDNIKSNINYLNSSYFLTTQKILQKQYVEDFGNLQQSPRKIKDIEDIVPYQMKTISSAVNYKCSFYPEICCSQGRRALKMVDKKSDFFKSCSKNCRYKSTKNKFLEDDMDGVTNFSYFLSETMYAKEMKPKELLIIDEGHNLYQELSNFIDIEISLQKLEKMNITSFPDKFYDFDNLNCEQQKYEVIKWIRYDFLEKLNKLKKQTNEKINNEVDNLDNKVSISDVEEENELKIEDDDFDGIESVVHKYESRNNTKNLSDFVKLNEFLDKLACNTRRFLKYYESQNWVLNVVYENTLVKEEIVDPTKQTVYKPIDSYFSKNEKDNVLIKINTGKKRYRKVYKDIITKIQFKPIDISRYSKELIFDYGFRVLIMSATILNKDKFCSLIGLESKQVPFLSIPSPFPPENKPILYCPVGKMSLQTIEYNFPKLVTIIQKILKKHKNEKGIIHCHSYKISNYILENLQSTRLLSHDSKDRDKILKKHIRSSKPTVLLSPSMEEGVDLKDDKSRFQIICKIPYPYLGDELVVHRMRKWNWWYSFETVKTIVQSIGRSIRSKTDHAKTYILDKCWESFYYQNRKIFPNDFHKLFITNKK